MKYYLTSHSRSVMDLWCDDETAVPNSHFLKHVKRLKGELNDPPFPDMDDADSILPYFPPFFMIKQYIRFSSEDRATVIEYAVMEALNCNATSREVETLLQYL